MRAFVFLSIVSLFAFFAFEPPSDVPSPSVAVGSAAAFDVPAGTDAWLKDTAGTAEEMPEEDGAGDTPEAVAATEENTDAVTEDATLPDAATESADGEMQTLEEDLPVDPEGGDALTDTADTPSDDATPAMESVDPLENAAALEELLEENTFVPEEEIAVPELILDPEETGAPVDTEVTTEETPGDIVELLQEQP